jgi:Arylsulfotransferase (ASST)
MNHRRRIAVLTLMSALVLCAHASAATVTISPLPGSPTALAKTQISFLGATASSLSSISVTGSASGRHSGHLRSYLAATGASFIPSKPFTAGEHVKVRARWKPAGAKPSTLSTSFTIAQPGAVAQTRFPTTPGRPSDAQSFLSEPNLQPPAVTVHRPAGAAGAPGYIFATPFLGPGQWGPMIFDNAGNLVWFHAVPVGQDAADFRTQIYEGRNDLTWWQGRTLALGYGLGEGVIANANYKTLAVVKAGNGLRADEHEFTITPQGTAYVLAYSPVHTSLQSAGGPASGLVLDGVIQEIDIRTGLVMWEWHSLGHIDLSESYSKLPALASNPFDYLHLDSLSLDGHGNILISGRNTWALYDINPRSGGIAWRLGGKRSTFTLGAGVPFAYQHSAEWLGSDEISMFDDEGAPAVKPPSRGEVVKLNLKSRTATLATKLVRSPGALASTSQGNAQALASGGWMVGWGGPNFTEFNAQGQEIYDAQLPAGESSYRIYREPWSAQPSEPPAIVAVPEGQTTHVYASWNGSTTVSSWQLLTGPDAAHLTVVATTPKTGFQTTISAPEAQFYEARALSASGNVLATLTASQPASE